MAKLKEDEVVPVVSAEDVKAAAVSQAPAHLDEQYLILTQDPNYTGPIFGVQITKGRGLLSARTVDERLGRSFEQIRDELEKIPGYTLQRVS